MYIREGDISAEAQHFLDYMFLPRSQGIIGEYVSPLMPEAGAFELEFFFGDVQRGSVQFREDVEDDIVLYLPPQSAEEFTVLAKNNTYHDGTFPKLSSYTGNVKTLENRGLLWVNRQSDPKTYNGLLGCNVTELRAGSIEQGDVMAFNYNGKTVTVVFDEQPDSGSSGCSGSGIGFLAAGLLAVGFHRRKS